MPPSVLSAAEVVVRGPATLQPTPLLLHDRAIGTHARIVRMDNAMTRGDGCAGRSSPLPVGALTWSAPGAPEKALDRLVRLAREVALPCGS